MNPQEAFQYYPDQEEIAAWLDRIWEQTELRSIKAEPVNRSLFVSNTQIGYINPILMKFTVSDLPAFYGIWYPPVNGPKPLLTFLPGYGSELSLVPMTASEEYAALSLCPMGYWTPDGQPDELRENGAWPVLPDTIRTRGNGGYFDWLLQAAMAVKWAWQQSEHVLPDRVSFWGTSQGGGTALLLGSLFMGRGTRCIMADEPFLTNYPAANFRGAYQVLENARGDVSEEDFWHYAGLVDTVSHADRLKVPVLITEGGADQVCPADTLRLLYDRLPATKAKFFMDGRGHGHNREFARFMLAWANLYA